MASMNKVLLMGGVTRQPELKYLPSGSAVCEFSIATSRKFTSNNEQKKEVCFTEITVFGKQAEACQKYLQKGSQALLEGRLKLDQWDDRETGKKRSKLSVIAENVQFIGNPNNQQSNQQQGGQQNSYNQDTQYQGQYQGGDFPAMPNDMNNEPESDSIPF